MIIILHSDHIIFSTFSTVNGYQNLGMGENHVVYTFKMATHHSSSFNDLLPSIQCFVKVLYHNLIFIV